MALFRKPKETYLPLGPPSLGAVAVPDVGVLRSGNQPILVLATTAQDNAKGIFDGSIPQPEPLKQLELRLLPVLLQRVDIGPDLDGERILRGATTMGFMMGIMENGGGAARAGASEAHYWNALVFIQTHVPEVVANVIGPQHDYALFAGYYVARSGEEEIDTVVANVSAQYTIPSVLPHGELIARYAGWLLDIGRSGRPGNLSR